MDIRSTAAVLGADSAAEQAASAVRLTKPAATAASRCHRGDNRGGVTSRSCITERDVSHLY